MNQPFMQLYVADYLGDTQHLSTEEHGAYLLLLMTMWRQGGELSSDERMLARIARVSARRWHLIAPAVMPFFDERDGKLTQKRLVEEYRKAVSKSEKRSVSGKAGGEAKALKEKERTVAIAIRLPQHSSESEPDIDSLGASAPSEPAEPDPFEAFWSAYPRREGPNPKKPARLAFDRAVKRGTPVPAIMAGVQALGRQHPKPTRFCPQASTWLNQDRFSDVDAKPARPPPAVDADEAEWRRRLNLARRGGRWFVDEWGPKPGMPRCRVPAHLVEANDGRDWTSRSRGS